ncbi:MAG: AsmA family protein, partial [Oceanospirillaceae bacterium]|nr:AsmA family protein [Oceanospirillaceae bacterium]
MRIVLKLILWLVILVVGLTASLAAYLMFFFNPNDYRTQIEERALGDAGVELKINGDIGWSFYPWLGLELKQLSVNYPGQPQLAELASAGAALNIPALLGGTVQLDSIRVDGLVLNLVRDAEGRENWVTAKGAQQESESGKGESERGQGDGELRLAIDQISLSNAKISFEDQIWARKVELNSLNLTASSVSVDKPFPINFQGALKQTDAGEVTTQAQMELSSEINLNALQGVFELRNLVSKVSLQQAGLEKPLIVDLNSDIRLVQADQRLSIDNLKLTLAGLSITGKLALTNFESQNLEGNLDIAEFNPRTLASSFGAELPELGEGALSKVAAKFALGGDAKSLQLNNLDLILDDTQISGALAINAESSAIVANLNVDQINLDRYMAPASTDVAAANEGPAEKGWSKEPLFDAEPLKAINAELKLQIGKALYQGNAIEQIALDLSAKAGDIRMKKLAAMAFGGSADVSGAIDARATPVKLAIKPNFSGIKVEQLMALAMEETPVKASANLTAALTTSGNSLHAIINGLNGELNLTAEEGVIEGIDMAQELCQKIENLTS